LISLHQVGELVQENTTVSGSNLGPDLLVSSVGSIDGSIDIFLGGTVDLADYLLSRRVNVLNKWSVTGNELVVDEELGMNWRQTKGELNTYIFHVQANKPYL
jgi:hypothetical protein